MLRAGLIFVLASIVLSYPLGSGASVDRTTSGPSATRTAAAAPGTITIRSRRGEGAWRPTSLSLKLDKTQLTTFAVCALWNQPSGAAWSKKCIAAAGDELPTGTILRLEQNPVLRALKRSDSPGWGMLALSDHAALEAVLSNTVSGNKYGTLHYRVTLRDSSGHVLATSNAIKLVWHR